MTIRANRLQIAAVLLGIAVLGCNRAPSREEQLRVYALEKERLVEIEKRALQAEEVRLWLNRAMEHQAQGLELTMNELYALEAMRKTNSDPEAVNEDADAISEQLKSQRARVKAAEKALAPYRTALLFFQGNGTAGTGSPKNRHSGPHPSPPHTFRTSSRSAGTSLMTRATQRS